MAGRRRCRRGCPAARRGSCRARAPVSPGIPPQPRIDGAYGHAGGSGHRPVWQHQAVTWHATPGRLAEYRPTESLLRGRPEPCLLL